MTLLFTAIGILLNVAVLRDIFQTLFNPSGSGAFSSRVVRYVWRGFRVICRRRPNALSFAGPLSLLLIILAWTLGLVLGWACILWPHLPGRFLLSTGLDPNQNDGFLDAVYVSMVTLGTLGYGEITPQTTLLRLVGPLEALIGFALFTASISWIMSIYPALFRQRHLARDVTLLHRSRQRSTTRPIDVSGTVLRDFTSQVISVRNDYVQFPIIYFYRTSDPMSSLGLALPSLLALARSVADHADAAERLQATMLLEAIEDLATHLAETSLELDPDEGTDTILRAFASDHLHDVEENVD